MTTGCGAERSAPWRQPTMLPHLDARTVHVWRVSLIGPPTWVQALERVLDREERERAARFRFERLRQRYVIAHAAVRQLLAGYLDAHPASLRFRTTAAGKPFLADPDPGQALSFNLSHSDDLALVAITRGRDVGVDLEHVRAELAADAIASRVFCPAERDALGQRDHASRTDLFFRFWSRKEAVLKATGDGLSVPLDHVDVSKASGGRPAPLSIVDGAGAVRRLSVVDLYPEAGCAGALAVDGAGWQYACWRFPPGLAPGRDS